jgi:hypothetical protein
VYTTGSFLILGSYRNFRDDERVRIPEKSRTATYVRVETRNTNATPRPFRGSISAVFQGPGQGSRHVENHVEAAIFTHRAPSLTETYVYTPLSFQYSKSIAQGSDACPAQHASQNRDC